jgi:outer membrane protein insertion porin family
MRFFLVLGWLILAGTVNAGDSDFIIEDIRVEGLQRVSAGSVFSSFPVNVGDKVDQSKLALATKRLFKVGLFTDIALAREGNVLIVTVVERPSISKIDVEGNKNIPEEDLLEGLRAVGLAEGEVFQRSTLERIELEILRSYVAQGRYNAQVNAEEEALPRNRVRLKIDIKEGPVSAIHHINVVGNMAFSDDKLLNLMELELNGFWASVFGSDKYSKQKLNGDLERIRSYYLDNGYIKFSIESTQVSVSPDKEQVFITVNVNEGPQYRIREILLKGDFKVAEDELRRLVGVKPGDIFSRQKLTQISDVIAKRLGAEGYTFASVNAIPEPHEDNSATVTFYVEPGNRTYVNRINFRGNVITSDEVLRQEMVQMEAAAASTDLIETSKSRLERLGFFKSVTVETPLVAGTNDKIDVNFAVEEQPTGSLSASLGYTQGSGANVGASISERNFWGTGRNVTLAVNRNESVSSARFSYKNPYFTIDGVSRGFSLYYRETNYDENDNITSYTSDSLGAAVNFGYPIDRFSKLEFGFGYNHTNIKLPNFPALEIRDFINDNGKSYDFFESSISWNRSTLNRGIFPTRGARNRLSAKLVLPEISDYNFFKVGYRNDQYFPITDSQEWAVHLRGETAYGDGYGGDSGLPFFENYFSGGISSVRGFDSNSLGPQSTPDPADDDPSHDPIGGNLQLETSLEFIFPFVLIEDRSQIRSLFFVDAGNVFNTAENVEPDLTLDEIRVTAGAGLTWLTPIGPLSFSLGKTLNSKPGDDKRFFQFLLGQTF